ncbi:hypothetical protein D3C73_1557750 [compost metagenome]
MALPFQCMAIEPSNSLGGSQVEGPRAAVFKECITLLIAAEEGQMKHMGRLIEVQ